MKKLIMIMILLVSFPIVLAGTNVSVSVVTGEDARVGVDCRASGTCKYDIGGEPFERLDEKWSKDTRGISRSDVSELFAESVGCIIGVDRFLGEHSRCKGSIHEKMTIALDSMFSHYMGFFVQRQEWSLYRQDKIMARQDMLMEELNITLDSMEVEMRTAAISYNRVGGKISTQSGYQCDVQNNQFVCVKELEK